MSPVLASHATVIWKFALAVLVIISIPIGLTEVNFLRRAALWENVHWTLATWGMTLLGYFGWRSAHGDLRRIRGIFTLGLLSYSMGQILWDIQWMMNYTVFPALSDVFYLGIAPFLIAGFMLTFRSGVSRGDALVMNLDSIIIFVGLATAIFALYAPRSLSLTPLATMVLVAYPVVFLATGVAGLVGALTVRAQFHRFSSPYILLLGLGLSGVCWVIWNSMALDQVIPPGSAVAYGFSFAHLVVGLGVGVWNSFPSENPRFERWVKISLWLLPILIIPMTVIVMVSPAAESATLRGPITLGGTMVILLAVIRQSVLLRERDILLTRERQALQRAEREIAERRQAETELQASEARFRLLAENAVAGILISDLDGEIVYANETLAHMFEYDSLQEFTAAGSVARYKDPARRIELLKQLRIQGRVTNFESEMLTRWNRSITVLHSTHLEGEMLFGTLTDITERKQAEERLRESEARLRVVVEAIPLPLTINSAEDGIILYGNSALSNMLKAPLSDIVGQRASDYYADADDRSRVLAEFKKRGLLNDHEVRLRRPDGALLTIALSTRAITFESKPCLLSCFYDITERRQAETALRAMNETLTALIRSSPLAIMVLGTEGMVRLWNPAAERVFGWSSEEVLGRPNPLLPPDREGSFKALTERILQGETVVNMEKRRRRKDGKPIDFNVSLSPMRDAHGNIEAILTMMSDITELKQAEEERENLITELTAKNAELERFTYTVSHDLKSPLVTITGFLGYLEQDTMSGNLERLKSDIKRIASAVDKMGQLLDDLLELSRVGRFVNQPEIIPFDNLIHEAMDLVDGMMKARNVTIELEPNFPSVFVDRQRLIEVLQNLLDNAAKYMGDQPHPLIEIGVEYGQQDGEPVFYIRDNGIGIAPEYHEKVFGLFNKLDARSEGTGIGLALVKRIIEFHGGRIWIESKLGIGTTFYFTLPAQPEAFESAEQKTNRQGGQA